MLRHRFEEPVGALRSLSRPFEGRHDAPERDLTEKVVLRAAVKKVSGAGRG